MTLKGNYQFMFTVQLLGGILTYLAMLKFGTIGIIIGFIPFLFALTVVHRRHTPDERETSLIHKADSWQGIVVTIIMVMVYMYLPQLNWFYVFAASISVTRGIIGILLFTIK
jgi:hypothetical protein